MVAILHNTTTSWHTLVTDEFSSNFDRIQKKTTAKTFQELTCRILKKPSCFCYLDWMTSHPLPPQLSQLFSAKFEFCNGGWPKPEIIAQLIILLVDIRT